MSDELTLDDEIELAREIECKFGNKSVKLANRLLAAFIYKEAKGRYVIYDGNGKIQKSVLLEEWRPDKNMNQLCEVFDAINHLNVRFSVNTITIYTGNFVKKTNSYIRKHDLCRDLYDSLVKYLMNNY